MPIFTREDRRALGVLLTPSWLSGLVAVCAGLAVSVGVIVIFSFHNSTVQQQLIVWQQSQAKHSQTLTVAGQIVPDQGNSTLQSSWTLIILWALVGLVAYNVTASIISAFGRASEIRESLDYVNANPRSILETTAEHILLKLIACGVLVILVREFIRKVLPYAITAAHENTTKLLSLHGVTHALLSFLVVVVGLHLLQTIFLRLALGKIRIFSVV